MSKFMEHHEKVAKVVSEAAIYIPFNCEAIRITAAIDEEGYFLGEGEETGEQYQCEYELVNFDEDLFYKLVLMEFE